jgi:hypothetical protein
MDVHVRRAVTNGLRLRGVDVITAQEDAADRLPDSSLLDRTTELGRILFTQDDDFLTEATRRQRANESFAGLVFAHQLNITIGQTIENLELIAKVGEPEDFVNRVEFLPL